MSPNRVSIVHTQSELLPLRRGGASSAEDLRRRCAVGSRPPGGHPLFPMLGVFGDRVRFNKVLMRRLLRQHPRRAGSRTSASLARSDGDVPRRALMISAANSAARSKSVVNRVVSTHRPCWTEPTQRIRFAASITPSGQTDNCPSKAAAIPFFKPPRTEDGRRSGVPLVASRLFARGRAKSRPPRNANAFGCSALLRAAAERTRRRNNQYGESIHVVSSDAGFLRTFRTVRARTRDDPRPTRLDEGWDRVIDLL